MSKPPPDDGLHIEYRKDYLLTHQKLLSADLDEAADEGLFHFLDRAFISLAIDLAAPGDETEDLPPGMPSTLLKALTQRDTDAIGESLGQPEDRDALIQLLTGRWGLDPEEAERTAVLLENGICEEDLVGVARMLILHGEALPTWLPALIGDPDGICATLMSLAEEVFEFVEDVRFTGGEMIDRLAEGEQPDLSSDYALQVFGDTLHAIYQELDEVSPWALGILHTPEIRGLLELMAGVRGQRLDTPDLEALETVIREDALEGHIRPLLEGSSDEADSDPA
jgi:hypothetical protein